MPTSAPRLAWVFAAIDLLASCGGGGGGGGGDAGGDPSFELSLSASTGAVDAGGSMSLTATIEAIDGFTGSVSLSVVDLPQGVTAQIAPATVIPTATAVITLDAAGEASGATRAIKVRASGGGITREAGFTLTVEALVAGGDFTVTLDPEAMSVVPGGTSTAEVTVTGQDGFAGSVDLSVTGLPSGVAGAFDPPAVAAGDTPVTATLTLTAAASAAPTTTPATAMVSGQAQGLSRAASVAVSVLAGDDPDVRRRETITQVEELLETLETQQLAPLDQLAAIAASMASMPDYVAVGVDPDTLSATGVFADGRLHIVTLSYEPGTPSDALLAPLAAGGEVPASSQARLLHSFGARFPTQASIDDAKTYLMSRGWMIRGGIEGDARVATLRGVAGDGFFYINTHGGRITAGVNPEREPDGKLYSIQSSTIVDTNLERIPEYADDLSQNRLVYFTAHNGETISILGFQVADWDTRYGITRYFIDQYWSFAQNAVVMINACFSSRNAEFIFSTLRKGAGVYLGWSDLIDVPTVNASLRYLVDRMVGANSDRPESPFQRPFPYDLVLADMKTKGLDTNATTGAKLEATPASQSGAPPILAPSIRSLVVDEYGGQLKLIGAFGSSPGKVTVGNHELSGCSFSPDTVTCTLPQSGAGSSGDVQVVTRGVKSNLRQLSEWTLSVHYGWTTPLFPTTGPTIDGSGTVRYRGDVSGYRDKPAEALKYLLRGMIATKDSALTVTASGSGNAGGCTSTLSGTGVFKSPSAQMEPYFVSPLKIDPQSRTGAIGLGFGASASPFTLTISGGRDCNISTPFPPVIGLLDGPDDFPQSQEENAMVFPLPALRLTFTPGFTFTFDHTAPQIPGNLHVSLTNLVMATPPRDDKESGK